VNQHVAILRANERVLPLILQKQLVLPVMKRLMLGHSAGGTRKAITKGHLEKFLIVVPPLAEQRRIAELLEALDDKIESNRRQCSLIDDLLRQEFAAITEHCLVRTPLANLATFTKGVSYRSAELSASGDTCLVTLKSVGRQGGYQPSGLKPYTGSPKPSQVLMPGELVVAQTDLTQAADVIGRVVRVPTDVDLGRLVASLDLVIVRPQGGMPREYLHGVLLEERFRQHCRSRSSGTTVLHLSRDALPQYEAPNIALVDQERFASSARPLLDRHDALGRESVRLAVLRDALLPELLSGRIRVPEAGGVGESALA
jgi:type I restriction enzyme S subunit